MSDLHKNPEQWPSLSDKELIDLINQTEQNEISHKSLAKEFERRNWNYLNILSLQLDKKIVEDQGVLFLAEVKYPAQVSIFWRKQLYPAVQYLLNHPLMKGKTPVTFDYLLQNLVLSENWVKVVDPKDLKNLTEDQVFVQVKYFDKLFPRTEEIEPFLKNNIRIIFHLDVYRKNYGPFEIIEVS